MKKLIPALLLLFCTVGIQAQVRIGLKAGANFSDLEGNFNSSMRTGFHGGAILEIKAFNNFALQPEVLYSMQGAKFDASGVDDINFSYVTVPVLVKYYLLTDVLSVDVGPQFAFLVDDNVSNSVANTFKTKSYDFALVGGVGLDIGKSLFAQAHYVVGLTDASTDALTNSNTKNRVIQLSVGFKF